MKKFIKWFVRLIACIVFVYIIFGTVISISIGFMPFSYYLNNTTDKIILLGIAISSFIASIITLLCSFQKVKIKVCAIFILVPVILSVILTYRNMSYIPPHQNGFLITDLNAKSKEECFKNAYCGTKKEISDLAKDPDIVKVGCSYDDYCKPPLFLKNPKTISCFGQTWEWKCLDGNCQCLIAGPYCEPFVDCPIEALDTETK